MPLKLLSLDRTHVLQWANDRAVLGAYGTRAVFLGFVHELDYYVEECHAAPRMLRGSASPAACLRPPLLIEELVPRQDMRQHVDEAAVSSATSAAVERADAQVLEDGGADLRQPVPNDTATTHSRPF